MAAAVDALTTKHATIDALVTAAGYYEEGIDVAVYISLVALDRMLSVIGGTANCAWSVLPHMLAQGPAA